MEKWIAIVSFALTIAGLIWGASRLWQKMNSRLDVVETKLAGQDVTQKQHTDDIGTLETALQVIGQQIVDHNERDDERFGNLKEALGVIHEDIKQLLRRSSGDLRP